MLSFSRKFISFSGGGECVSVRETSNQLWCNIVKHVYFIWMFLVYSYCKRNWSFSFNSTDLAHILSTNIHLFVHINPYSIYLLAQSILSTGLLLKCDRTNKIETFQCFYLHFISRLNGAWHLHCTHWILCSFFCSARNCS